MGISAVGIGSGGVLTQDLLDKLRKADENAKLIPIDLNIANEKDKKAEYNLIQANVQNLSDSIEAIKNATVFDARVATTTGSSVEITADDKSDVQDFTLDVKELATKEITESAKYGSDTDKIATDDGSITLHIGTKDYTIDYNADMTLKDFKNAINNEAGDDVTASIIKVADNDFRLYFTSKNIFLEKR
jgi:flagellar hook-associated protein 2